MILYVHINSVLRMGGLRGWGYMPPGDPEVFDARNAARRLHASWRAFKYAAVRVRTYVYVCGKVCKHKHSMVFVSNARHSWAWWHMHVQVLFVYVLCLWARMTGLDMPVFGSNRLLCPAEHMSLFARKWYVRMTCTRISYHKYKYYTLTYKAHTRTTSIVRVFDKMWKCTAFGVVHFPCLEWH